MAFVNRKDRTVIEVAESKPVVKEKQSTLELIDNLSVADNSMNEKKHYLEEAKYIINLLEEREGFDFYDENRTGGMFLGGKNRKKNNILSQLVNRGNKKENTNRSSLLAGLLQKAKENGKE